VAQLVAVSVLVDQLKNKNVMQVHVVTSLGEDGVHVAYKELDKFSSNCEVIGVKMNGPTEQEIALHPDTDAQTLIAWITTNFLQQHL